MIYLSIALYLVGLCCLVFAARQVILDNREE